MSLLETPTHKYNEVSEVIHKNGQLFLKTFLIDDTANKLGWKMHPDFLHKYINTAIGRPAILNGIHYHPLEFNHIRSTDYHDYLKAQEPYHVGTIKHIYEGSLPNTFDALIEITDPRLIKAYEKGELKIPRYVSPAVYAFDANSDEIKDYEFLHLAFVDEPAYGTLKANVKGECNGTQDTCLAHLKQAATDNPTCNICPVTELNRFQNTLSNSSYLQSDSKKEVSALDNNNTTVENKPVEAQSTQPNTENKAAIVAEQKPVETTVQVENKAPIKAPVVQSETQSPVQSKEEIKTEAPKESPEIIALKEQLASLTSSLNELKADKESREKAEAEHKEHSKRELIEKYVTSDSCSGNEEERERRIKAFMNIPIEELEYFLQTHYILPESPCSKAVKQGGIARRATDFNKKEIPASNTNVKQAGISEEETIKAKKLVQFVSLSSSNSGGRYS